MDKLSELIQQKIVVLDGAMGTMLQNSGLKIGEKPELLNVTNPSLITKIHKDYLLAGADIIYTNTFGANSVKLKNYDYKAAIIKGVECAKTAVAEVKPSALVAYDIGSVGELVEPMGSLTFDEVYEIVKEQVLLASRADLFVLETMSDLYEVKAAMLAIKENSDKPIMVTMSFDENGRTFSGCPIEAFVAVVEGLGASALGMNCSLGPKQIDGIVKRLLDKSSIPVIVKPNAGLPIVNCGQVSYDVDAEEFSSILAKYAELGVGIVGGCCGTTKEYIEKLSQKVLKISAPNIAPKQNCDLASGTMYLNIDKPRIVGERINPTGKKLMKQAIKERNFAYFQNLAIEQADIGAEILDVNMGIPNIDEAEMMMSAVKSIQRVTSLPLQIDSSLVAAIEKGLRYCNGKAIVNSVNGSEKVLDEVLPLVKKYGALVIGLTLDENGIPNTALERLEIAKRILNKAKEYGIPKQNVIIDCLTLTVGAEQAQARITLDAIRLVKSELGLKTTLGVSNISFGLPNRELINTSFLTMALTAGLDLPIINFNLPSVQASVSAFRLLAGFDKNGEEFIKKFSEAAADSVLSSELNLSDCILKSLTKRAVELTRELIKTQSGLSIIDEYVIPALDKIGLDYQNGKLFLPQLISASEAAKAVCDVIKLNMNVEATANKAKIILATVQGDVHDIGKNIVKTVLQNYGYNVIDLGKDVLIDEVWAAVKQHKPAVLGLSALMTTTVKNMEATIKAVRRIDDKVIICVGGAVLSSSVAKEIGADVYTKDPQELVKFLQAKGL